MSSLALRAWSRSVSLSGRDANADSRRAGYGYARGKQWFRLSLASRAKYPRAEHQSPHHQGPNCGQEHGARGYVFGLARQRVVSGGG